MYFFVMFELGLHARFTEKFKSLSKVVVEISCTA